MSRDEAVRFLLDAKVPVAPVYNVDEVVVDPQLNERGMFVDVEHPNAGRVRVVNFPVKFSETPVEIRSAAPVLGQDNVDVLTELLGYDEGRISALRQAGVISG